MKSSYRHDDMVINGRSIPIKSIVNGTAEAKSDFEQKTFAFISDWLSDNRSFVQQTSGSTGDPKQITITRSQMIASATMSIEALGLRSGDNALLCINPDYIGGKMVLVRSLMADMKVVAVTPSSNPFRGLSNLERIDFAAMVPYQIHEIVRSDEASKFNDIRTVIIGGAAIDRETENRLQRYRCTFFSTYGMTETVSHIALRQLNGERSSDYYRVLKGIRISVDERSCLVIEWQHLPDKVITNDIVEIVNSGAFRWIGRWDNVINTGGVKVIPEKIESIVKEIFHRLDIHNSFFVGSVSDTLLGNKVTLFIEGQLTNELIDVVEQQMAQILPKNEVPKQVKLLKSFVLTENGKINRKATTKPYTGTDVT